MLGMLIVGVLMYLLFRTLGQYYIDGVGYATVQAVLTGQISSLWLLGLLSFMQGAGDLAQSGLGLIRWNFLPVAVHRSDPGRGLRGAAQ